MKKQPSGKVYRNGDWHLVPTDAAISNAIKHDGSFVFAEGEATGHLHVMNVENKDDMILSKCADGSYLVEFKSKATLTHPEHSMKGDLIVAPGRYRLVQRREKDWYQMTTRKVID